VLRDRLQRRCKNHAQIHYRTRSSRHRQRRARNAESSAAKSNAVLQQLSPKIQWVESYVAGTRPFASILAENEDVIHKHSQLSGFPANKITEIRKMIDPTTANG